MAMGLPVVVTNFSGPTAYLSEAVGYPLQYQMVDVPPGSGAFSGDGLGGSCGLQGARPVAHMGGTWPCRMCPPWLAAPQHASAGPRILLCLAVSTRCTAVHPLPTPLPHPAQPPTAAQVTAGRSRLPST